MSAKPKTYHFEKYTCVSFVTLSKIKVVNNFNREFDSANKDMDCSEISTGSLTITLRKLAHAINRDFSHL